MTPVTWAPRDLGEIESHAAPAGADVEHARIGLNEELAGDVALLGELRIVERLLGMLEIGAAVLPVGVEEERVELLVEIVVMRNVAARAGGRIELRKPAPEIAHEPLQARPARDLAGFVLRHGKMKEVRDRAPLHHERAVHVGFADFQFGIEQHPPLRRRGS